MSSDTGSVTGRVTTQVTTNGIGGVYVAIVSAYDTSVELYNTTSDAMGYYQFTNVSVNDSYRVRVSTTIGEGYSDVFGVSPGTVTTTSVVIHTQPSGMAITATRYFVVANGMDYTMITARVTDGFGYPVDGCSVVFSLQNYTSDIAQFGNASNGLPLGTNATWVVTEDGNASIAFGWTTNPDGVYSIVANLADNCYVSSMATVYAWPVLQHGTGTVAGRVTYGNTAMGLNQTLVTLCRPCEPDQVINSTYTDAEGYFQMPGVNDTVDDRGYASLSYMLYAYNDTFGMGYSGCFGVMPNVTKSENISIFPPPAAIEVTTGRDTVAADGNDNTTINMYVTDFLGNPTNEYTVWVRLLNAGNGMGRLTDEFEYSNGGDLYLTVVNGSASAKFGWMSVPGATNTIIVSSTDNLSVYGTANVTSEAADIETGSVTGRVTTQNTTTGIGGAYVAIVSANNTSVELYNTTSDAYGYYQFTGVNSTLRSDGSLENAYLVRAYDPRYGEGCSGSFGVRPNTTTVTSVIIFTKPAMMVVTSSKGQVLANNADNTTVTAYVTDAFGAPVADGYRICFSINNRSGDAVQLGNADTGLLLGTNCTNVMTKGGYARVLFGWASTPDTNYTVTASWADNGSVAISTVIYSAVQHGKGAVTGRVTTSTGNGVNGANVTIVSIYNPSLELYNTTSDANGYYNFTGINDTLYANGTLGNTYMIRVYNLTYGECYSTAFGVSPGNTTLTSVVISKPVKIVVTAEKSKISPNGADHTTISAYVTDAFGMPAANDTLVRFHMSTSSSGMGMFARADSGVPESSGDMIVPTAGGYAKIEFGWMTKAKVSNTIYAYWADSSAVKGSITISSANR